jgi:hypothetical protein
VERFSLKKRNDVEVTKMHHVNPQIDLQRWKTWTMMVWKQRVFGKLLDYVGFSYREPRLLGTETA